MQLIELQTFLAIIETGSLVRASQRLNVTQSTVTARLKSLEAELGQALINRQKSGASLTAAGVRLQRYASTISNLWQQARQETALPDALSSVCNIACHPDLWEGFGQVLFDYVRLELPHVALSVWQGNEAEMSRWLKAGLADIALTYSSNADQTQEVVPFFDDQLVLVSTDPDSPLKFDPGYVFIEAGEAFEKEHAAAYADANTARISFGVAGLGLNFILNEGGTAYLPMRIAKPYVDEGRLYLLKTAPIFKRKAFIIVNKTAQNSWPWFDELLIDVGLVCKT